MDYDKAILGIELGSTRIKAVVLNENLKVAARGSFEWENKLVNGIWTYSMDEVINGIRACYCDLTDNMGMCPSRYAAIGISGMMHGYLPFNEKWELLAEFRTWRNSITAGAADALTREFDFNIPQRWSIAHLYQAILNGEEHVKDVAHITTLSGYIHFLLTGENAVGIGEASGMFPIDSRNKCYRRDMLERFDSVSGLNRKVETLLPKVLVAGSAAGELSPSGAALLDPSGKLKSGIPMAPCEGDAGTGMVATNSVRFHTGNVSAGTSVFSMIVTDHSLSVHKEIDMVTTPNGHPAAMVHCSNCSSDMNAWVGLFSELLKYMGKRTEKGELFTRLFEKALEGSPECGDLLSYNYYSGESITAVDVGCPVFLRTPDSDFTLSNFMRMHIQSAFATLRIGMDILRREGVRIEHLCAHGGIFKTPIVAQRLLSAAMGVPVLITETAGEGGAYGMALLASYMLNRTENETLEDYLDDKVFASVETSRLMASSEDIEGFAEFMARYVKAFVVEKAAAESLL